jgi:hypothetical protein
MVVHSQEQTTLKLKKLEFTLVAKVLPISIQITFLHATAILAHCLKSPRKKTWMSKKNKTTFLYTSQ